MNCQWQTQASNRCALQICISLQRIPASKQAILGQCWRILGILAIYYQYWDNVSNISYQDQYFYRYLLQYCTNIDIYWVILAISLWLLRTCVWLNETIKLSFRKFNHPYIKYDKCITNIRLFCVCRQNSSYDEEVNMKIDIGLGQALVLSRQANARESKQIG